MFTQIKAIALATVLSAPALDDENLPGVYNVWVKTQLPGKTPRMILSLLHFGGISDDAKLAALTEKWTVGARMHIEGEPIFQINDIDANGNPITGVGNPIIRGDINDEGGLFCGYDLMVHTSSFIGQGKADDQDYYHLFGVARVTSEATITYNTKTSKAFWQLGINIPRWTRNIKGIVDSFTHKADDPMQSPRWIKLIASGERAEDIAKKGVIGKGEYVWFEGDPSTDPDNSGYIVPFARKDQSGQPTGEYGSSYSIWLDTFRFKHAVVEKQTAVGGASSRSNESNESEIPF